MYKTNLHSFKIKEKKIIIDVESSSVFLINDKKGITSDKIKKVIRDAVKNKIRTNYNEEFTEINPQLQLCLSMSCNLSCKYCAFRKRDADKKIKTMSIDTAIKAINLFFKILPHNQKYARIDFGVSGEPFIMERYHEILKKYIRKMCNKYKKIVWAGANMTNGLIYDPDVMIKKIGNPMDISIDGRKKDHDKFRVYKAGKKSTYDDLLKLIKRANENTINIGTCSVITSDTLNIKDNFKHLFDLGIRSSIYMKVVNARHSEKYSLNKKNLQKFKKSYQDFIEFLLKQPDNNLIQYLNVINPEDFFFRFFYKILNRSSLRYRCNAGKSGLYVDTDGRLYPCAHFVGIAGQEIGTVYKGIEKKGRNLFINQKVNQRTPCKNCWAKYFCGGGCYYQGWLVNSNINKPDLVKCELIKHFIKLQSYFISEIIDKKPIVLSSLINSSMLGGINAVPPEREGKFYPRVLHLHEKKQLNFDNDGHKIRIFRISDFMHIEIRSIKLLESEVIIDKQVKNCYDWDEFCFYKDVNEYDLYVFDKKNMRLKYYEKLHKNNLIEIPFRNKESDKRNKDKTIRMYSNGFDIKIPIEKKSKIGINITINDGIHKFRLIPETIGILSLKSGEERLNALSPSILKTYVDKYSRTIVTPLWINYENDNSNVFRRDKHDFSYDSSVC